MAPTKSSNEEYICSILKQEFGREVIALAPIDGGKNSTIYTISISASDGSTPTRQPRPAVSALPNAAVKLAMRLSNPDAMLNEAVRVQSEVATMALMRNALEPLGTNLVPTVYGWAPSDDDGKGGWVLMEFMPGESLGAKFKSLGATRQQDIIEQMAEVFKTFRSYKLPPTVKGFGGLNFDDEGDIIVGATPIHGGGPCDTIQELYSDYFRTQLAFAEKCDVVKAWKNTTLRARIDKFAAEKLGELLESLPLAARPTLVHADFDVHNLLFDPRTNRLTALVDFDFSHVASQADEYFYSLAKPGHLVTSPIINDTSLAANRQCLLTGFTRGAELRLDGPVEWKLAVMMDKALAEAGVERPQDIQGIDELSTLYWFIQDISPPIFFLKRFRDKAAPEKIEMIRAATEENLDMYLSRWGY